MMEAGKVQVESRFGILDPLGLEIESTPGGHGYARVEIPYVEPYGREILLAGEDEVQIRQGEDILFSGVLSKLMTKRGREGEMLTIEAYTGTIRMDVEKKSRSFQEDGTTYTSLFKGIVGGYGGDILMDRGDWEVVHGLLVQYEETDWEFLKRAASKLGRALVPDMLSSLPRVFIGVPRLEAAGEDPPDYRMEKSLHTYRLAKAAGEKLADSSHAGYRIESQENYQLGARVNYKGQDFLVTGKWGTLTQGVLEKVYRLQKPRGCLVLPYPSEKATGLGLKGEVLEVEGDKVKIGLDIDRGEGGGQWFQAHALYSGGGSTGIYTMPEIQESAYLYLPEGEGGNGYIRASHRGDGPGDGQDPTCKYISIPGGEALKMSQDELGLSTGNGRISLSTTRGGVQIESQEKIEIKSSGTVRLKGARISLHAGKEIAIEAGGSSILMDNLTHIKGKKIKLDGSGRGCV